MFQRSPNVIELEKPTIQSIEIPSKMQIQLRLGGIFVAMMIISIWAVSLSLLLAIDISNFNFFIILSLIFWQTFLYTGLFITAHDAMHGVVFPQNIKLNHFIGSLCLCLYGFLPYKKLLKKHWLHHHYPASELDPDFHDGNNENFFLWYLYFMKNYGDWQQIASLIVLYNLIVFCLHIPSENLTYFWVIPSLLSSLQLFYFGTFLPHREPKEGYIEPHRAQTIPRSIWWSFITCYHFGYHQEHHEYPHLAWWQLPRIYKIIHNA